MEGARPAVEADLPRLVELAEAGLAELLPMRGGNVWAASRAGTPPDVWLRDALADPGQVVVVGTIDDTVIGFARVHTTRLSDGRTLGVVDELFVEPEARGVGVGEAMMDDVLSWCREHRCFGVDAVALPGHRATKNFYEESGLTTRLLIMHRALE